MDGEDTRRNILDRIKLDLPRPARTAAGDAAGEKTP